MSDVTWTDLEIPIAGLDEGVDKRILPPGKFVSVVNGDYVKPGTIRKRPGIVRVVSGFANDFPQGDRLARWRNQIFMFDATDTLAVHQINETSGEYPYLPPGGLPPIPTATAQATPITNDLTRDVLADVAVTTNGFLVYGILGRPGSGSTLPSAGIVRVVESSSGAVVLEQEVGLTHDAKYVRAAASGTTVLVSFSGTASPNNLISAVAVDCASGTPTLVLSGALTTIDLASDVHADWLAHESVGLTLTTDRWVIIWRQASTNALRLRRITYTGTTLTFGSAVTIATGTVTHISAILANAGNDIVINWAQLNGSGAGNFQYAVHDATALTAVLAPTVWLLTTPHNVNALATSIGSYSSGSEDDFLLFASHTRDITTDSTPITYYATATRGGVVGTPRWKRRISVTSKAWQRDNRQHIWAITRQGISAGEYSYTLVLLSVPNNPDATYRGIGMTVAGSTLETSGYPQAAAPPNIQNTSSLQCVPGSYAYWEGTYHTCQHVIYVPREFRIGPIDCEVRYDHLGRYSNVEFGGSTYCAGGVVTEWDGSVLREVGAVQKPNIICTLDSVTGTGTWSTPGNYYYLAVYEFVDAITQRHRFLKSNVEIVNVGATDLVDISLDALTLTRASDKLYISIYRSVSPTELNFQRLFRYDATPDALANDPDQLDWITYTDTGAIDNVDNEVLYTESGEFENDMPYGGATAICVHRDRLWLGGGMDPEVVWYSKPRVDGLPAEFTIAQTFRVPGEEVVALGSLDDQLIIFCKKGIYAVFGDGPDVTGQGRPFDYPTLINAEMVCNGPRSVIQIPQGLLFQTRNGIYILDHKRNITYIGEPLKDTMVLYPIVRGVANEARRGEVLYALSDVSGTAGTVAVFNYLQGLWATWEHKKRNADEETDLTPWADLCPWLDREIVYLAQNGCIYEQQATTGIYSDDLLFYPLDVETGWISFGRMQGYKKIRKVGVLLERLGTHGLTLGLKYGYDETGGSTLVWDAIRLDKVGAVEWLRVTVPRQKTPAIKLRLTETEAAGAEVGSNADTRGFAIDGYAFQIGMIPGLMRLPAAQSG